MDLYNTQRPCYAVGTITTVADQEAYDLPAGGHLVVGVAPVSQVDDVWSAITGTTTDTPITQLGDSLIYFHQPSQADILRQKMEQWSRQFGSGWEQYEPGGKVYLRPTPDGVNTLAILYTSDHAANGSTIAAAEERLLIMAGKAVALEALATVSAGNVATSGGRLTLGPYTRDMGGVGTVGTALFGQAEKAKQAFLRAAFRAPAAQKG